MNPSFWKGKKVFVTGHTGFKGSWLVLWLQRLGAETTGFSLPPPTSPSHFAVADIGRDMETIEGDVRDLDGLKNAMSKTSPVVARTTQGYETPQGRPLGSGPLPRGGG